MAEHIPGTGDAVVESLAFGMWALGRPQELFGRSRDAAWLLDSNAAARAQFRAYAQYAVNWLTPGAARVTPGADPSAVPPGPPNPLLAAAAPDAAVGIGQDAGMVLAGLGEDVAALTRVHLVTDQVGAAVAAEDRGWNTALAAVLDLLAQRTPPPEPRAAEHGPMVDGLTETPGTPPVGLGR